MEKTIINKVDKDRLDLVLKLIDDYKIKFPVATISKKLGRGKGEVSEYLNGKKPMSENFYNLFIEQYPLKISDATNKQALASLQAAVRILTLEVIQLRHVVNKESVTQVSLELDRMMKQEVERLLG